MARSLRLSVLGFAESGFADASTGELSLHADDVRFRGGQRPFEAGVGRSRETPR